MKKTLSAVLSMVLALGLAACGSSTSAGAPADPAAGQAAETSGEAAPAQSSGASELAVAEGTLKYTGFEKQNAELTDESKALVFYFDYTNLTNEVKEVQNTFYIQFFQNGVELSKNPSYSSKGGEQYELVGAYFNDVLKNGTVHFGRIVVPEDDSPITVMLSSKGEDKTNTMFEVNISGGEGTAAAAEPEAAAVTISAEDLDGLLQGTWKLSDNTGEMAFDNGSMVISGGGQMMDGNYEISTEESAVKGTFEVDGKTLVITIPYTYEDGVLKIFNNRNVELIKQ